ncbi:MAG: DUF4435 domain-containing protein [archaeon]|nr:DUF4435 domain-containing protein [archaeon]
MIAHLTAHDISNEMSMMRSAFKGTFLVVEGASDCRLYSKFVDSESVRIMVAHSKNNVIGSVGEMTGRRADGKTLGIVDRDMDSLLGRRRSPPIFLTDRRDMESTILSCDALDDVLSEYADREKLETFVRDHGSVGSCVSAGAARLGILMYLSFWKVMYLSFKDLDHTLFINPRTLEVDIPKMVASVYGNSMQQRIPRAAVVEQIRQNLEQTGSSWDIARGHDAVAILRIGLRNAFGSYNCRGITDGELGGALRLAYGREYFERSELFRATSEWCEANGIILWNLKNGKE